MSPSIAVACRDVTQLLIFQPRHSINCDRSPIFVPVQRVRDAVPGLYSEPTHSKHQHEKRFVTITA